MHSAFCCGLKMFQSSMDVVWKCSQGSFKVASKMSEDVFKVERIRNGDSTTMDGYQTK